MTDTIYTLDPDGSLRPLKIRLPGPLDPLEPRTIGPEEAAELDALPIHTMPPRRI